MSYLQPEMLQSELAIVFRMNRTDVKSKLGKMSPCGKRGLYDLYEVKEAARLLVRPPDDMVERILHMHSSDLPPNLSKEYWTGQNQRINYMERIGDLWSTTAVIDLAGDAFKTIRLSLMLMADEVERVAGLDEKQREIIAGLITATLDNMRGKLVDGLKVGREHTVGKSFSPEEDDPAAGL